jgi:TPP-dependent pyruvate/acetoin dehydrogenase alpha subunit
VDGNNVLEVYEKAGEAIARARSGGGPTLLECLTYRWYGHHEGDPGVAYRTREEVAAWKERDPVKRLKDEAIASGTLTAEDFEQIDGEVAAVLEDAAQFALASALEDESTALRYVYAE